MTSRDRLCDKALAEVPVQRRPAHPEVLRNVLAGVAISLHALRGGDVIGVLDLAGSPELGAVGARGLTLVFDPGVVVRARVGPRPPRPR
jgi:hypothetical protein